MYHLVVVLKKLTVISKVMYIFSYLNHTHSCKYVCKITVCECPFIECCSGQTVVRGRSMQLQMMADTRGRSSQTGEDSSPGPLRSTLRLGRYFSIPNNYLVMQLKLLHVRGYSLLQHIDKHPV